ncbi:hypothetical protein BC940DRAFT_294537 [Gongronella butleri]|nr:hypothetical protein BC940DRAFT_294537 [Gongronella butleri]
MDRLFFWHSWRFYYAMQSWVQFGAFPRTWFSNFRFGRWSRQIFDLRLVCPNASSVLPNRHILPKMLILQRVCTGKPEDAQCAVENDAALHMHAPYCHSLLTARDSALKNALNWTKRLHYAFFCDHLHARMLRIEMREQLKIQGPTVECHHH